jgi:hypothetical protein
MTPPAAPTGTPQTAPARKPSAVERAAQALEWPRFLELAVAEARTAPGKSATELLSDPARWAPDAPAARLLQQETQEITPLLDRDGLWGPLAELPDPWGELDRLARGTRAQESTA